MSNTSIIILPVLLNLASKTELIWSISGRFEPHSSEKLSVFRAKFMEIVRRWEVILGSVIVFHWSTSELCICAMFPIDTILLLTGHNTALVLLSGTTIQKKV